MKLKGLKIGTQLRVSLGAILVFVVSLGVLAWIQTDQLWLQIQTMYDHPLQVGRALGALEADIRTIHRGMKDLALAANDQEAAAALQLIEIRKIDASRQFTVLFDRYLGPKADITSLHDQFTKWNAIHDETIRLHQAGKSAEATARTKADGMGGAQAEVLMNHIKKVSEFAVNMGNQIYLNATEQNASLNRHLLVIVAVIFLLTLLASWRLLRAIRNPLQQMTTAAEQFRQGRVDARSEYVSANEFGSLSTAFNTLADTVETRMRIDAQAARLVGAMLRENQAKDFCRELLKALIEHTNSQMVAIYLLDQQKAAFEHFESIGLGPGGRASFSAAEAEGEFGAALTTGRMQRVSDIPQDSRFTFASVSGDFMPREIITLPILSGQEAVAVLSMASLQGYGPDTLRLLEEITDTLTARVNGVLAFRKVQELAGRLEHQNRELEAQAQEMAAQAGELAAQNAELEMQKRQLDEANRIKSVFLSNMSHELRTPLNSVIALSGVLSRRLARIVPQEEYGYLEIIERNGKNLLALINDILDLSRIEAGKEEINLDHFSLGALTEEIVGMLEPQAREKNLALGNLIDKDLPRLVSDPDKCRHILQNLIGNAVKFTEAGSVEISARRVGEELLVSVRDTGIGIAPDQLPHIFEEFRQADGSTSRKYGGTGLGLAIASRYAALLRGAITVESIPGRGSTFTLKLPFTISSDEAQVGAPPHLHGGLGQTVSGSEGAAGNGRRILLVEDNQPAVIQMTDILAGQGYRVDVAHNGKEALAQIESAPPEAVILDLMIPEMDGFEVLRQMRSSQRSASLPVLILTAKHVTKAELSFLKGNHIHQLIQKGDINKDQLLASVAAMVAAPVEDLARPARPRPVKARQGKQVVLVVEDNPDNFRTIQALLKDDYVILGAEDGADGVKQAIRHSPDIILMDLALPVMDGFTALEKIRRVRALEHVPVIAVTASAMKGDRDEILARGFDAYVSKPIDVKLLTETIREALS